MKEDRFSEYEMLSRIEASETRYGYFGRERKVQGFPLVLFLLGLLNG